MFYFSFVSHYDHALIINLETIKTLSEFDDIKVICRDNVPVDILEQACEKYGCHYLANSKEQGFAKNNNDNYRYARHTLGMTEDDYFILINPDIYMDKVNIQKLLQLLTEQTTPLGTVNLYLDKEELLFDDNIRLYPTITDFIKSFLFNDRSTMLNRYALLPNQDSIWLSGAFMIVNAGIYEQVGMLNEQYYLYCEDVDFCHRLKKRGVYPTIISEVKGIHYRRRRSKQIFNNYFRWHVSSVFRYTLRKLNQFKY